MSAERTIGNYVLGPLLGRGGMSEVHVATHRFLGDRVAIKLLRAHLASDEATAAAFIAEATQTRAIAHPHVVRVLDFGRDGDDLYLVMELLEGESLETRIVRAGALSEAEVRRLGAAIADGAAAAHDRGIVHRDLKPSNVVLVDDQPKIVDFGIARYLGRASATVTASRVGTLAYMAPEQLTSGVIAPSVDIWALGAMLYEALTGALPFDGFTGGRAPQLVDPLPRLSSRVKVSGELEAIVSACLERDPARRPSTMREVAGALRGAWSAGSERRTEDVAPRSDGAATRVEAAARGGDARATTKAPRPARRGRWAVAMIAIAGLGGSAWALARRADEAAPAIAAPAVAPAIASSAEDAHPAPRVVAVEAPPSESPVRAAAPAPITVEIRSTPSGAAVMLDGKRVATTPATLDVAIATSLVIARPGYRASRIVAERAGAITVHLAPARRASKPVPPRAGETLD